MIALNWGWRIYSLGHSSSNQLFVNNYLEDSPLIHAHHFLCSRWLLVCAVFVAGNWCNTGYPDSKHSFVVSVDMPVHMPGATRVHATALKELAGAFPNASPEALHLFKDDVPASGSIFVGLLDESQTAQKSGAARGD